MKTLGAFLGMVFIAVNFSGCTTKWLRYNTSNQAETTSDVLAQQVLYNLAVAKNFADDNPHDDRNFNGIPAFVTLVSGQASIQDSATPQISAAFPFHTWTGNQIGGQIQGVHQVTDNWSFAPVVDPNVLKRLYNLYRSQFTFIKQDSVDNIFLAPPQLDQSGRPMLHYEPRPGPGGTVELTNNQPVFDVFPIKRELKTVAAIPGAWQNSDGKVTEPWFKIDPDHPDKCKWFWAGKYRGRKIWITDREKFVQFAWLALGGTNGAPSLAPRFMLFQNGFLTTPGNSILQ
jgi:hypothetical protein